MWAEDIFERVEREKKASAKDAAARIRARADVEEARMTQKKMREDVKWVKGAPRRHAKMYGDGVPRLG